MALLVALSALVTSTAAPELVPPRLLEDSPAITAPEGAPPLFENAEVVVRIRVDERGEVDHVELIRGIGEPYDAAVLEGAAKLKFEPALYGGTAVPVDIKFAQRFSAAVIETPPPIEEEPPLPPSGVLSGRLEERGTRTPLAFATVTARNDTVNTSTISDEKGDFSLHLPEGTVWVEIHSGGYRPFLQNETITRDEELRVLYLVERISTNPYEVVVRTEKQRDTISKTKLRGRDISRIPGTFGDPFRVVSTLPGVTQMMSLLPFPIVRGSSPGNTGFLIDGIRVPLLFHLLAGPSVIHPEMIDEIEFSPGAFPAEYGGYTGGIVDGKTRRNDKAETYVDTDFNFFQAGGLVRKPLDDIGTTFAVAGRYGFPGLLLSLASSEIALSYWDYQARIDSGGFTLFVFGARDALDAIPEGAPEDAEKEPLLRFHFHRLDLRYQHQIGELDAHYQIAFGYDDSLSQEDAKLSSTSATPRLRFRYPLSSSLDLLFGADGSAKSADLDPGESGLGELGVLLGEDAEPSGTLYSAGLYAETLWRPSDAFLFRPGVRVDAYYDGDTRHVSVDPRLSARARLYHGETSLWLKGGVGLYHQPPRFTIPLPGLDQIAFEQGLLASVQSTIGAELELPRGWSVDVQTYLNYADPIFYDVQVNLGVEDVLNMEPAAPPGEEPPEPPRDRDDLDDRLGELLEPAIGRSYGAEFLVRRQDPSGLSGWISYTFSRSERRRDGEWIAFDFDRTHILNFVLSMPLPRSWLVGLRTQVQSGRPLTTTSGLARARTDTFVRFDVRIDKTAVWNDWLLDFYVDISNVVLGAEELAPESELRYVLPTLGFRAIF